MEEQGILQADPEAEAEGEFDPETDEGYTKAVDLVKTKLYDEDIADGIAQAITAADDKVAAIVEQASMLMNIADDMTQGSVPDELYVTFGVEMLGEVVEIAEAAGVKLGGSEMAVATREFITQMIEGLGGDMTQVKEAMAQINPDELGGAMDQARG